MSRNTSNINFNSQRNITNRRFKNLKDGKAIKISNDNEIDVNFITNTTGKLTLQEFDLLLVSDALGSNIQFITGLSIIQAANDSLVAGNNINFTISGNHRQINVDSALTSIVSIDSTTATGLVLKKSSVDRVSIGASSTRFYGYSTTLGGVLLIDQGTGGQANTQPYEVLQDYLSINGFRPNKIDTGLRIRRKITDSPDIDQFFCGNQQDEGNCVIVNPNNDLHYIFRSGELKISKPDLSAHDFSINLGNSASTFSINLNGTDEAFKISSTTVDIYKKVDLNGNLLTFKTDDDYQYIRYFGTGMDGLEYHGFGTTSTSASHRFKCGSAGTAVLELYPDKVEIAKEVDLNGNLLTFKTDDDYQYIRYFGTDMDGLEYHGFGTTSTSASHRFKCGSAGTAVLELFPDKVEIAKEVDLNGNILTFKTDDDFQYIRYFGTGMDGLEYHGYGLTTTSASHRFKCGSAGTAVLELYPDKVDIGKPLYMNDNRLDLSSDSSARDKYYIETNRTDPIFTTEIRGFRGISLGTTEGSDTERMKIGTGRIDMYKPLYMNSTTSDDRPIYLHNNTDFFIKYQNSTGQNVVECRGYNGVHLGSIAANAVNLKVEQDRVEITKMRVIDFINLDNKEIRLRGATDPWQILGYKNDSESINGNNINIDGWFMRGWNGGRLASVQGIFPPAESNSIHHAVWYMSNNLPRFGGPYGYHTTSDDRIKFEETTITNALETINKLNPVLYKKGKYIGDTDYSSMKIESGFVAQEVYNNVPEMRHLVDFDKSLSRNFVNGDLSGDCVEDIYSRKTNSDGVTKEKPELCTVSYDEITPFTVKAIQELHILVDTLREQLTTQSTLISNLQAQINNNLVNNK